MTVHYPEIMLLTTEDRFSWTKRDAIIYALGIGLPADPLDARELRFVYEPDLGVVPTFVVTIPFANGPLNDAGIEYRYILHGEQAITLNKPLPASGTVTGRGKMIGAWDKGVGKGGVFAQSMELYLDGDDEPLATVVTTVFGRADGGFGGLTEGQPKPHPVPDRAPDHSVDLPTTGSQAILYRLSGDANPLHIDPGVAREAGFERPILHGLCTYAIACRAVMQTYCDMDPSRIRHHQARFSSPVYPGETITVDLWKDGDTVSFEARVKDRDVTVIRNGKTVLTPEPHL
jgi:acyl dehydratase